MSKYQGEPISITLQAYTDSTKVTQVSLEDKTLELLLIRTTTDNVIYCIEDGSLTKIQNSATFTLPAIVTAYLQPGDYKFQLSDITIPTDPIIGIAEQSFTLLKSFKKCT